MTTGRTVLAGLLGRGIQLSRTPHMHEAEGAAQGLGYCYRLLDTDLLAADITVGEVLRAAEICQFAGLNITYPFKVAVLEHLDELAEEVEAVGAVNTVVFRNGRRIGHNTDFSGFAESFRRNMPDAARACVLLVGAGGGGAAVAHALIACETSRLLVFDTQRDRAEGLAARIRARHGNDRAKALPDLGDPAVATADGLVNATPFGMASLPGMPVPAGLLHAGMWVADIVYFPLETELLAQARMRGCRVLPGSGMAIFQAARAFEHFSGISPDIARMEAAFHAFGRQGL